MCNSNYCQGSLGLFRMRPAASNGSQLAEGVWAVSETREFEGSRGGVLKRYGD